MSYEEAVSALRRQLGNISDSILEKDKLIVQLNEAYRHEEKVPMYVYVEDCNLCIVCMLVCGQLVKKYQRKFIDLPKVFEVALRCSDGESNWCLIRYQCRLQCKA